LFFDARLMVIVQKGVALSNNSNGTRLGSQGSFFARDVTKIWRDAISINPV
jgi:hypothetical protein